MAVTATTCLGANGNERENGLPPDKSEVNYRNIIEPDKLELRFKCIHVHYTYTHTLTSTPQTNTHTHTHTCSAGYEHSYESASAVSTSSESEFEPGFSKKKKKNKKSKSHGESSDFIRMTSRKRGVVSYKESVSDNSEGNGVEGGEGGEEATTQVEDNRETIDRVLRKRVGPVGGEFMLEFLSEN